MRDDEMRALLDSYHRAVMIADMVYLGRKSH